MKSNARTSSFMFGPRPPGSPEKLPDLEPCWLDLDSERKLFYYRGGKRNAPTMFFLHGIGGWAEQWLPLLPAVEDFNWIIPDLPGFGRSSKPREATSDGMIGPLDALLDAEGLDRCIMVGNSLGSGFALKMVITRPERYEALILSNAAGILRNISLMFRVALVPWIGNFILGNLHPIMKLRWAVQFGNRKLVTDEFVDDIIRFSRQYDCRPTYLSLLKLGTNFRGLLEVVTEGLPDIKQPVLLVWGARDIVIPPNQGDYASKLMPDIHYELFEGCGHYPHWERPERFNRLVTSFLQENNLRKGLDHNNGD